ncbi:tyrosine-type recombinase/integrase [Yoonia sp. GPGPB17]|uniref:tyrosine-type recombinase/integrase n=1 Tax=Yoonia sp. GPGPB17 TaxID=3026147 RepID=UPI0030BC11A6
MRALTLKALSWRFQALGGLVKALITLETYETIQARRYSKGIAPNRSTAYRWIKRLMADANIRGVQACPKSLRHGFGIHALNASIPLNLLQKWMGHADLSTTAIYANASGAEERGIAERMW